MLYSTTCNKVGRCAAYIAATTCRNAKFTNAAAHTRDSGVQHQQTAQCLLSHVAFNVVTLNACIVLCLWMSSALQTAITSDSRMKDDSASQHLIAQFFLNQTMITACWWLIVDYMLKKSATSVLASGSVFVLPGRIAHKHEIAFINLLKKHKHAVCGTIMLLSLLSAYSSSVWSTFTSSLVRIVYGITFACYHLLESSFSGRHGEFPVLYCVIAC